MAIDNAKLTRMVKHQSDTIVKMAQAIKRRDEEIKANGEAQEKTGRLVDSLGKTLGNIQKTINDEIAKGGGIALHPHGDAPKSAGEAFIESDVYKKSDYSTIVRGQAVNVKSFYKANMTTDATAATAGNGGLTLQPYRPTEWIDETEKRLTIRDLLSTQSITENSVEYVRVTEFDNNADYRPETTAAKESSLTFGLQTANIRSIAHWMPASREILNDQSRMRNFIDQKLIYGIKYKEEQELLYGTGANGGMTGFMVDAEIPTFSRGQAGDSFIDVLRRSMTDVRMNEYAATGFIVNPIDFESIELAKGTDGHYIWLNVPTGTGQTIFRVPIIDTPAMTRDNFITGAFKQAATLYDRESANVRFSESHDDFFTKGMLAIMAEERIGLSIERPNAFVKGKLTVTP